MVVIDPYPCTMHIEPVGVCEFVIIEISTFVFLYPRAPDAFDSWLAIRRRGDDI